MILEFKMIFPRRSEKLPFILSVEFIGITELLFVEFKGKHVYNDGHLNILIDYDENNSSIKVLSCLSSYKILREKMQKGKSSKCQKANSSETKPKCISVIYLGQREYIASVTTSVGTYCNWFSIWYLLKFGSRISELLPSTTYFHVALQHFVDTD